jgi:photosystem II stability/assembly factor-like uncharacterized protein
MSLQAQFTRVYTLFNGRVEDITFSDSDIQTGWAAASPGLILKTGNGGLTWDTAMYMPDHYMRSVDFVSPAVGFAGSLDSVMYKSTDAGDTWQPIPRNTFPADFAGICGMDHSGGVLYGAGYYDGSPYLIKTTDLGATWTVKDLSAQCDGLVDVLCISPTEVILSGQTDHYTRGIVLKSTDGGNQFTEVFHTGSTQEMNNIWKLFRIDNTPVVYASVERLFNDSMYVLKSTDAGDTWTNTYIGEGVANIQGIGFLNPSHGFMIGHFAGFYETTDGGDTWEYGWDSVALFYSGDRLCKRSNGDLFAAGNGIIYYGNSLGLPSSPPSPVPLHTMEIFPNPVTDKIQIDVNLAMHTLVSVSLYDASGKLVKYVHRGNHPEGKYIFSDDLSSLPAGTYFISLVTNTNHVQRKIIKR